MTDIQFFDPKTCLVVAINATSFQLSGIAKDLCDKYPHANLFEGRKQLYNLNRAVKTNRPDVGSLVVKEPPGESNFPFVVGLISQFGPGEAVEYNEVAKYFVDCSRDMHFVNGLISDTEPNRREYFKRCLMNLADYALQNKSIQRIVFPSGIGRRGKVDHDWKTFYLREIKAFARQLDLNGIKVVILEREEVAEHRPSATTGAISKL